MADASGPKQQYTDDTPMPSIRVGDAITSKAEKRPKTKSRGSGNLKADMTFPDEATCGFTQAEFESAVKVMGCLEQNAEVYETRAMKPIRKVVFSFVQKSQAEFFGGVTPGEYRRRKSNDKTKRRVHNQVMHHDRQLIESRKLRMSRLNQLNALKEANPLSNVPLIPDGAVDDGTGVNQSIGQAGGSSSVPLVITENGETTHSEQTQEMQDLLNSAFDEVAKSRQAADIHENYKLARGPGTDVGDERTQQQQLSKETHKLLRARSCYTCKGRFWELHHFYDQMCPSCAALNWRKRLQTCDLSGRVALLTGGRVKIGYQIGLKLLRCGAALVVTTRFPADAALRFSREQDYPKWRDRLSIFGIDLRDIAAVERMTQTLNQKLERLDVIVNNACQTIRRPAAYYRHLLENEAKVASEHDQRRSVPVASITNGGENGGAFDVIMPDGHHGLVAITNEPRSIVATLDSQTRSDTTTSGDVSGSAVAAESTVSASEPVVPKNMRHVPSALLSQVHLTEEDADDNPDLFPVDSYDVNAQQVDLRTTNSWLLTLSQVSTAEAVEVMAVNSLAPMIINARLKGLMERSRATDLDTKNNSTRGDIGRYIVNVSAMEGKFYRHKNANHPHTNMAKAALNMMTRTSASDYVKSGIYMTAVDTGWINDENPLEMAARTAEKNNFQTPIDEVDAASRVLDPVMSGVMETDSSKRQFGIFLKDYRETEW